jgi:hypothetical protein
MGVSGSGWSRGLELLASVSLTSVSVSVVEVSDVARDSIAVAMARLASF